MNRICRHLPCGVALGCLIVLAGCGSAPPQAVESETDSASNHYIGTRPIYSHLEQVSGGTWMLKTVTESDSPPDKGYLVRLNDLAPAFDIRVAECEPQAYPSNHKCNLEQPFRDKEIGVIDRIISGGIAAGTAGRVTELSRTYTTSFDEAAFNQAVDEALINTGLSSERREFLLALNQYDLILEDGRSELATRREHALSRYHNTATLKLDIRPEITGLTRYYSADIDFRDLVRLEPQTTLTSNMAPVTRQSILPCDARRCTAEARAAIDELRATIEQGKASLNAALADEMSEYALSCEATSHASYEFVLDCPDSITVAGAATGPVSVTINILSRDFDAVYPQFDIDDRNLSVDVDGKLIRFSNHTDSYVSITAWTVYYNSQVQTIPERIDMAPGVVIERPIDELVTPAIRIEASYRQMTPDKAKGASFEFGFAVSYRLAGATEETTLYDLQSFNVGCVIDNQIQPGSCQYPSTDAAADITESKQEEQLSRHRAERPTF